MTNKNTTAKLKDKKSLSFNTCLIDFTEPIDKDVLPSKFTYPFDYEPHRVCLRASEQVQIYLKTQQEWQHNFGLVEGKTGPIIGKMFGVLVVQTQADEIGFLAAFSGKIANGYQPPYFVPPIYETPAKGGFVNDGMTELTRINQQIKKLEGLQTIAADKEVQQLKYFRKEHSRTLQERLHNQYQFLNIAGVEKSLPAIFSKFNYKNPPSGAGNCAAPKLLQYAFKQEMKPIALAEFWWGQSPKSAYWKHRQFYPCCHEKCEPILDHMLEGMDVEDKANE